MKILSVLIFAFAISFSASAQNSQDTTHRKMHHQYSQSTIHERYIMKDGKLMKDKNGVKTAVTNDVTLNNGTTITTDGKVTWKNGKTQTLQNAEMISMNGKIYNGKNNSMNHTAMHHNSSQHHSMHSNSMRNNADSSK